MVEEKVDTSKRHVQARIADWIARLDALYDRLEEWREELYPEAVSERGSTLQYQEGLMKDFGVKPRKIPTYVIHRGRRRISFVPRALWVLAANGRVDIIATYPWRHYTLADIAEGENEAPDWQVALPTTRRLIAPLDRALFAKIVENRL